MHVCTTDEMTVTFSSTIPVEKKTIVVPYVDINAKVTNFFPFCTIGISMYQKRILPYFIIPSTFSPQASSPLERYGQTEGRTNFNTPRYLTSFFLKKLAKSAPPLRFNIHVPSSRNVLLFSTPSFFLLFYALNLQISSVRLWP
jgi:hypothetical protein